MAKFQIGKAKINQGLIDSLNVYFEKNKVARISALKNSERDKEKIKEMADELCLKLNGNYKYRIIGFTIILKKTSSPKK